jgi:O-antigen/teichoic acid export membrane protein
LKRLASDALFAATSHVTAAVSALTVQVILVKCLSRDAFGAFALAQSFVIAFESMLVARSGELALQLIGKAWDDEGGAARSLVKQLRREELRWNIVVGIVLAFIAVILSSALCLDAVLAITLGLVIPLQSGYGVSKAVIVVADRIKQQSLFEITLSLLTVLGIGVAVWQFGLAAAVAGYLSIALIKTFWAHVWANRLIRALCPIGVTRNDEIKHHAFHGLSAIAVWRNACVAIASQADILMVGSALGNEGAALYRVAKTLAGLPARIVAPIWTVLRPRFLAALRKDEPSALVRLVSVPGIVLFVLGMLAYPLLATGAPTLIEVIFSVAYRDAAESMLILAIGTWIFSGVTGWLGFLAIIVDRKRATTALFTINTLIIVLAGVLVRDDIRSMALAVCTASLITSAGAWCWLIASFHLSARKLNRTTDSARLL